MKALNFISTNDMVCNRWGNYKKVHVDGTTYDDDDDYDEDKNCEKYMKLHLSLLYVMG